ncbi:hypothetical protein [Burkholderia gladioli]|uniref:hypothetical protein n=1 Tax=Burkholderia gladioli TaxID=28095 RepID=UPI00163FE8EB|nr:hypothetical protein [Burkholderia gladioli]
MPVTAASFSPVIGTGRIHRVGLLAQIYAGMDLPLQVLRSAAGYYIGTAHAGESVSRESHEYFTTHAAAADALANDSWHQRAHP